MAVAIGLRNDFDAAGLRRLAGATKSANQGRRLLALAEIYDGGNRGDAAQDPDAIEAFKKGGLPPSWIRSERVSRTASR